MINRLLYLVGKKIKRIKKFPKINVSIDRCGCYPNACWESGVSSTSKNINSSRQTKRRQSVKQEWWHEVFLIALYWAVYIQRSCIENRSQHGKHQIKKNSNNNNKINIKWWKDYSKQGNCTSTCTIPLCNKSLDLSPVKMRLLFQEIASLLHQEIHARLSYHCIKGEVHVCYLGQKTSRY